MINGKITAIVQGTRAAYYRLEGLDLDRETDNPTTKPVIRAVFALVPQNALILIPLFVSLESLPDYMDKQNAPKQVHNAHLKADWDWDTATGLAQGLMWPGRSGVRGRGWLGKHRLHWQ